MPQPIAPSELILNPNGSVYHLNLRPEQLANTIITVGDPGRVATVSQHFEHIEHRVEKREFVTHTGTFRNKRLTVLSTGIGTDNIDIVLNELDALVNIDLGTRQIRDTLRSLSIVRLGTSGTLHADIPVDSLVLSSHGLGLDNVLHYYNHEQEGPLQRLEQEILEHTRLEGFNIRPYLVSGDELLLDHFSQLGTSGITATCSGFYGPQGRQLRLPPAIPDILDRLASFHNGNHRITNFEMETSAIYGLGKLLGHRCLSINTIIANRAKGEFSKDPKAAVEQMIRRALELLVTVE